MEKHRASPDLAALSTARPGGKPPPPWPERSVSRGDASGPAGLWAQPAEVATLRRQQKTNNLGSRPSSGFLPIQAPGLCCTHRASQGPSPAGGILLGVSPPGMEPRRPNSALQALHAKVSFCPSCSLHSLSPSDLGRLIIRAGSRGSCADPAANEDWFQILLLAGQEVSEDQSSTGQFPRPALGTASNWPGFS